MDDPLATDVSNNRNAILSACIFILATTTLCKSFNPIAVVVKSSKGAFYQIGIFDKYSKRIAFLSVLPPPQIAQYILASANCIPQIDF